MMVQELPAPRGLDSASSFLAGSAALSGINPVLVLLFAAWTPGQSALGDTRMPTRCMLTVSVAFLSCGIGACFSKVITATQGLDGVQCELLVEPVGTSIGAGHGCLGRKLAAGWLLHAVHLTAAASVSLQLTSLAGALELCIVSCPSALHRTGHSLACRGA